MKKIFIVSTARSELGLLKNIIFKLNKIRKYKISVLISGTHLSKKYGYTINELDNISSKNIIRFKIPIGISSNENSVKFSVNLMKNLSALIRFEKPSALIVFGDRFEVLAISYVGYLFKIPIVHIGGGETTSGSRDESIRHAISKLADYHFVTHNLHKKRLIQLGEKKQNIFVIGSPGVENAKKIKIIHKKKLEKKFNFKFYKKNILISYYCVSSNKKKVIYEINQLLKSLKSFKNVRFIFTLPAFEIGSDLVKREIKKFVKLNDNAIMFKSLGTQNYISFLKYSNVILGNSSSSLIEAPEMGTNVINIGDRQKNRIKPKGVLDVPCESIKIKNAIDKSLKKKIKFQSIYPNIETSKKFSKIFSELNLKDGLFKKFYDLDFNKK
jgi:GDP/UDP-N,N'-diacetylbacillosamine 2-epimerase (hydrolysing)